MAIKEVIKHGTEILRPKARIIGIIGSELISDDNVAIIELVKNSYDADSSSVIIAFEGPMLEENGRIVISDNGDGMTMDSVKHGWMEPATGEKIVHQTSPGGRRMLGEKGIGRFASAKLARSLTLVTRVPHGDEIVARFNWANFESSDKYLDEIKCEWEIREPKLIPVKGTMLIMEQVRESWDERKMESLKLALSRLINPWAPMKGFEIALDTSKAQEKLRKFNGQIGSPPSLGNPHYSLRGTIDSRGNCAMQYTSRKAKRSENFTGAYENKHMIGLSCGPFSFEFRVWDRDDLESLAREYGTTLREIRRDLDNACGISVYRDSFRVLPYGESARKNDWLGLDLRRVQNPTMRLSNNQVVGQVSINLNSNPNLKDQSNREGIVHTIEFEDFADKVVWVLARLEQERYQERSNARPAHIDGGIFSKINIQPVVELIKQKLPNDADANKLVRATELQINEGIKKVKEVISRYHRLSTLGMLVDVALHDGSDILVKLDNQVRIVENELHEVRPDFSKINKRILLISNEKGRLAALFRRLEPFGGRIRGPVKTIILEDAIRNVFILFQEELLRSNIEYGISNTETEYKVDLSGFESIIVNLLQNSIYWINSQKTEGGAIDVQISQERGNVSIIFSDSGPGVAEANQDFIFDPYFTTKPNGIGLGLTIAGEQALEYGGSVELLANGPLKGATFRITLPGAVQ